MVRGGLLSFGAAFTDFFLLLIIVGRKWGGRFPTGINWTITFLCVVVGWVFFRASNFHEATAVLRAMTDITNVVLPISYAQHVGWLQEFGVSFAVMQGNLPFGKAFGLTLFLLVIAMKVPNVHQWAWNLKPTKKLMIAIITVFLYVLVSLNRQSEFLYFQF